MTAQTRACVQVCLDDRNSKGDARDPGCVMRNRVAAYLYSKEATEKPIPSVSPIARTRHCPSALCSLCTLGYIVTLRDAGRMECVSGLM